MIDRSIGSYGDDLADFGILSSVRIVFFCLMAEHLKLSIKTVFFCLMVDNCCLCTQAL